MSFDGSQSSVQSSPASISNLLENRFFVTGMAVNLSLTQFSLPRIENRT
uniref:Uncharacterized protein n=1 Tax=Rhizobium rhizogenes TaxID=359 RepID=A0A7S4ZT90_RHIRH|nr:hypothetical protein pC6.5d_739 [Rhizobium rhizogenes]